MTTEWAIRFKNLQMPPHVYMLNSNQPYDTAREGITRGVLSHGVKWLLHLDTDVLIPINAVPLMIEWAEKFNLPLLSGLYWAKKPKSTTGGVPMAAAWLKIGEKPEENRIEFAPLDVKPHMVNLPNKSPLVRCDVVGAGCLLIKADIFKKLDESNPNLPYFEWGLGRRDPTGKPLPQMSEDFYFCMRCVKELGINPHLAVAVQCDHICNAVKRGSDGEFELLTLRG